MTRLLSRLLSASEPHFRLSLQQLEEVSGRPSADIRLSTELVQHLQQKLRELGLNPQDTTAEELYTALNAQLINDEEKLKVHLGLRQSSSASEIQSSVQHFVESLGLSHQILGLKAQSSKKMLKLADPKKTMRALGYRSLDSMLKHEPMAQIYIATLYYETPHWRNNFLNLYKNLQSSDFELRDIQVLRPTQSRWTSVARRISEELYYQPVIAIRELGALVILPMPSAIPALTITSTLLMIESWSDLHCSSTYLKLKQMTTDFGNYVKQVAEDEPTLPIELAGRALPWHVLHQFYGEIKDDWQTLWFGPQIEPEDLATIQAETTLTKAVPNLEFWHDCSALMMLSGERVVSLNILDVALNVSNQFTFEQRGFQHGQQQIWQTLLLRYLHHLPPQRILLEPERDEALDMVPDDFTPSEALHE